MPPSISSTNDHLSQTHPTSSKPGKPDTSATAETPTRNGPSSRTEDSASSPIGVVKVRPRANTRKEPPTLLTDFFRGKQSPARLAAERKRRHSLDLVKAELRQEMRQSTVRKLQQPGGVRDRVEKWQKAHADAMLEGDPDDAATEPTDVAFKGDDGESVTESDRVRIKFRQKKRSPSKPTSSPESLHRRPRSERDVDDDKCVTPTAASPPKKRVVSDEHWRKPRARRTTSRKLSPSSRRHRISPQGLPSDFVQKSGGGNPGVSNKVKEWAGKVQMYEAPSPIPSHRSSKSVDAVARSEGAKSDAGNSASDITARWVTRRKKGRDSRDPARPANTKKSDDDGIRVYTITSTLSRDSWDMNDARVSRSRSKTTSGSGRPNSPSARSRASLTPTDVFRRADDQKNERGSNTRGARERSHSMLDTPTKGRGSLRQGPKIHTGKSSRLSEEHSKLSSTRDTASDVASSLTNKSLADIPGDIPFGHSAFSELDLTIKGQLRSRPKRPAVDTNASLKSVPKIFKKVVEESKKIIQEMNEPPRHQVANKPPSIEKWLNNTVDPFVDSKSKTEKNSPSAEQTEEKPDKMPQGTTTTKPHRRRSSHGAKSSRKSSSSLVDAEEKNAPHEPAPSETEDPSTPDSAKHTATTPTSTGLKRSRATRNSSSPVKGSNGKRQLLGVLKDVFQGESNALPVQLKGYQGSEQRKFSHSEEVPAPLRLRKSQPPSPATDATLCGQRSEDEEPSGFKLAAPRFRPPTRGNHELSTIVSEEGSSVVDSDLSSDVTQSTVTQSTVLTKDSENSKPHTGLKRRLTKHSDLVSVLSLPDDSTVPNTMQSYRSRPSLRKHRSTSGSVTAQELLREFMDDENLYGRELKTVVDGVIPVLLSHVVNGTNVTELFGPSLSASGKVPESVSKSVVNMGVALEKLRSAHKKAPTSDVRKLANWAHGVVPMYSSYLSAWRLGFDDIVVNLAPAADDTVDDESLLAALPRNEKGDLVNDAGQQVAVAYLLKRPLIRVKQLAKLVKCVDALVSSADTRELLQDFENLLNKVRRRFKEEVARVVDEEAAFTDKSRCRNLETLDSLPAVTIDPTRQVSAKDVFSLSLSHSNNQRLDCQVELVHRDNQKDSSDEGDLLIREIGEGRRSYLLFPPIAMSDISARTGDNHLEMVVMIRGTSADGSVWREFITLRSDSEDQILDWLDILPLLPVPPLNIGPETSGAFPKAFAPSTSTTPTTPTQRREARTVTPSSGSSPEGSPRSPIAKDVCTSTPPSVAAKKATPARYRPRTSTMDRVPSPAAAPPESDAIDPDKTPTRRYHHGGSVNEDRGRPLDESMWPDYSQIPEKKQERQQSRPTTIPNRDDGAPPPPIHRTLNTSPGAGGGPSTKSLPSLAVSVTDSHGSDRLKRRGSSPLKHEYLPSDQSSVSEAYSTDESDGESSDDELESLDIPETELGISIKSETQTSPYQAAPHFMMDSQYSLTPSNSASQVGLPGLKNAINDQVTYFMARVSRWSDKGAWKDILNDPCAIIVRNGSIEAFVLRTTEAEPSDAEPPILALDLTPLVLIRQSTAVDLEIRSSVQSHCKLYKSHYAGNFRFRCFVAPECYNLYMSVHQARLNNQRFIQLANQARFKSFGERQRFDIDDGDSGGGGGGGPGNGNGIGIGNVTGRRRRTWFGRKNSYRSSVRAPSQSQDSGSTTPSSTPSASSFLKRLTKNGNLSFNIARSSINKRSRGNSSGGNSLYTSRSSSSSGTPPRSPSVSVENSGHRLTNIGGAEGIRIRLHLLVPPAKWEDYGNCILQITRPPPGWRQALRADHGLEKRITVTTLPRKESEEAKVVLDAVLGSGCFSAMGSRGIVCGVWEEVKNGDGVVGMVPETGATGGNIRKWCFQFANAAEANGVLRLVHQEVLRL
ncbi:hypothetical protein E4U43_000052 [Claviceps pusilla]|uniref:SRm160/300 splicing coactivator n=1 Tax=Claviceps pusilla TaxID=123648 RepID=A0A9P7T0E0_9HYPO|nr:hypothetical protein E4U43_000052 [Claviceps pusilla]